MLDYVINRIFSVYFSNDKMYEPSKHFTISTEFTFFIVIKNNKTEIIQQNSLPLSNFKKFIQF
jgi:hypothetical protein